MKARHLRIGVLAHTCVSARFEREASKIKCWEETVVYWFKAEFNRWATIEAPPLSDAFK